MKKGADHFSKGVLVYALFFFLVYKTLFQLSYVHEFSSLWYWAYGLIVVHIIGLLWCLVACLVRLMPRQFGSFICAALLVVGLQFVSPDPMMVHFWMHRSEYLQEVAAAPTVPDGRVSVVLYSYGYYVPSMPGGYLCADEIVYDDSNDVALISRTVDGRASVKKIEGNFYFRYPPCG
jgi:hypothetical protein